MLSDDDAGEVLCVWSFGNVLVALTTLPWMMLLFPMLCKVVTVVLWTTFCLPWESGDRLSSMISFLSKRPAVPSSSSFLRSEMVLFTPEPGADRSRDDGDSGGV